MEEQQVADLIQIRRDTASNWTSANPTLAQGELGIETDTSKIKVGDGSTAWNSKTYLVDVGSYITASSTDTLTNKTLSAGVLAGVTTTASGNLVVDPATQIVEVKGDGSSVEGQIKLNCHANSHGQTLKSQPHSVNATNTMLLPQGANSTLVSLVSTDTLTNKTLTSPVLTAPVLGTPASGTMTNVTGLPPAGVVGTAAILGANTFTGTQNLSDNTLQRANLLDYGEITNAIGNATGAKTIDLTLGNSVTATTTGATTWTFSNPTASDELCGFSIKLVNGGSATQTWPASVDWPAATAPTLTTSGTDVLVFTTCDGGTTWYGFVAGLALA